MSIESLAPTRAAWHQVAEHVLAAALYADTGRIDLQSIAGGFQTGAPLADGRELAVVLGDLVVTDAQVRRIEPLTTVAAAAAFVGMTPGLPAGIYPAATALDPDAALSIDLASAQQLADWYQLGDSAMRRLAAEVGAPPPQPILWPEHFDVGITLGDVNYGASPGDDEIGEPYLYVGPHAGPPTRDDFWNASFGAARTIAEIADLAAGVEFFRSGHKRLSG